MVGCKLQCRRSPGFEQSLLRGIQASRTKQARLGIFKRELTSRPSSFRAMTRLRMCCRQPDRVCGGSNLQFDIAASAVVADPHVEESPGGSMPADYRGAAVRVRPAKW